MRFSIASTFERMICFICELLLLKILDIDVFGGILYGIVALEETGHFGVVTQIFGKLLSVVVVLNDDVLDLFESLVNELVSVNNR